MTTALLNQSSGPEYNLFLTCFGRTMKRVCVNSCYRTSNFEPRVETSQSTLTFRLGNVDMEILQLCIRDVSIAL
jgi:hypothetical protein